jgi:hypothetical protein
VSKTIILPYDGSAEARAALRRVGRVISEGSTRDSYDGIILATAGVDPSELERLTDEAGAIAGPDVRVQVCLLNAGDPIGGLRELAASLPDAVLAAPVHATGRSAWYAQACRLGGLPHGLMLLFLRPNEIKAFEASTRRRQRAVNRFGGLLRAGARLRSGA